MKKLMDMERILEYLSENNITSYDSFMLVFFLAFFIAILIAAWKDAINDSKALGTYKNQKFVFISIVSVFVVPVLVLGIVLYLKMIITALF